MLITIDVDTDALEKWAARQVLLRSLGLLPAPTIADEIAAAIYGVILQEKNRGNGDDNEN